MSSQRPRLAVLSTEDLFVDHSYQRGEQKLVAQIVQDFDPALVGVPAVSDRGSGEYALVDGQQRWIAHTRLGIPTMRCDVFSGLTVREEADLYWRMNKHRKPVSQLEQFKAQIYAGEPEATAINQVVEDAGWRIGKVKPGASSNVIGAVVAVRTVYRWKQSYQGPAEPGQILRAALELMNTWKGIRSANNGAWLMGMAYFVRDYGTKFTDAQREALEALIPLKEIGRAKSELKHFGGSGVTTSLGLQIADQLRAATRRQRRRRRD